MRSYDAFRKKADAFLLNYTNAHPFSGVLRVTHKDQVIWERAAGMADFERGVPFSKDSMFTFYSLSKPFCVIGLLLLVQQGRVKLDDHPGKYLTEATGFHRDVTLRHMLHHLSGVPDYMQTEGFREAHGPGTPENLRRQTVEIAKYPQLFQPGTQAMYTNLNILVPALIIEALTGMDYGDYMQKQVFAPLGMETAQVDRLGRSVEHRVQGYGLEGDRIVPVERCMDWMRGAGDIIGTVDDVYRLNLAIKHRKLLHADLWQQILTPSPLNGMGLGCTITAQDGRLRITHNGGHVGFRTLHDQYLEEDFDIILLSNFGFGDARGDFRDALYEAFFGDAALEHGEMDKGYI